MKKITITFSLNKEWWAKVKQLANQWLPIKVEVKQVKEE